MDYSSHVSALLPTDLDRAVVVGRVRVPGEAGARVVTVRDSRFVDLTEQWATMADLLDHDAPARAVRDGRGGDEWSVDDVVTTTLTGSGTAPSLISPIDLQVIKAAGVTFARSMIERVIEERAAGDPALAAEVRARIAETIGGAISELIPGSAEAEEAKRVLIAHGLWSQYLEVGIGPDPEIFTKAPVLSSVGVAADIGVLSRSEWNNPEPEVVLAVSSSGAPVGAALGNDVNLRDFEGRSALLLTEAKDNNGSCAIGPMIRLFDDDFTLDDVRALDITLRITGDDGFELHGGSSMAEISRPIEELIGHAFGPHHQYPDGFVLFTGTLFAPTQDRDAPGLGFTHHNNDVVSISTPSLGTLVNRVRPSEELEPWRIGIRAFYRDLAERGLLRGGAR